MCANHFTNYSLSTYFFKGLREAVEKNNSLYTRSRTKQERRWIWSRVVFSRRRMTNMMEKSYRAGPLEIRNDVATTAGRGEDERFCE